MSAYNEFHIRSGVRPGYRPRSKWHPFAVAACFLTIGSIVLAVGLYLAMGVR
jgi:hypothetical protein